MIIPSHYNPSEQTIFKEGYNAYNLELNVFTVNPYKEQVNNNPQPEAIMFFTGWADAESDYKKKHLFLEREYVLPLNGWDYSIFLDDYRVPFHVWWAKLPQTTNWLIARHYYEFVKLIENLQMPKFIAWDHDLDRHGNQEIYKLPGKNGMDCLEWLINYCETCKLQFPDSIVHSTNPKDGPKMTKRIDDYLDSKF